MDNTDNLALNDIIVGGGVIDSAASGVKNTAAGIRNKAKAKKAQKISDAGQYATLTPFQKSLIPVPAYMLQSGKTETEVANSEAVVSGLSKYIPYAIGIVLLGVVLYFVLKRK